MTAAAERPASRVKRVEPAPPVLNKVLLDLSVLLLCLPISLRAIGGRGICLDLDHAIELLHELGDKLRTMVTDNLLGNPEAFEDVIAKESSCPF